MTEYEQCKEALIDIEAMLVDVSRYPNMIAFEVVVSLCKKAANRAAEGLNRSPPFPNHHEITKPPESLNHG